MSALDALYGEGATASYEAAHELIGPAEFTYADLPNGVVRVYINWASGADCKVDLSVDTVRYHRLNASNGVGYEGLLSGLAQHVYPWYLAHGLVHLIAHPASPESAAILKRSGMQEHPTRGWRQLQEDFSPDSRVEEWVDYLEGGTSPDWYEELEEM